MESGLIRGWAIVVALTTVDEITPEFELVAFDSIGVLTRNRLAQ